MAERISTTAARLDRAAVRATATEQSLGDNMLSLDDAYAVQHALMDHRLRRGAHRIGMKMGFTSRAKMAQMGVADMIWGRLSSDMLIEDGGDIDLAHYVHARVEPELCFLLSKPLEGMVTPLQALASVEAIAPALEVIDSRYENFKFSLSDVVADNASSAGVVVGAWHKPDIDFSNLGLIMSINGRPVELGTTAALLGHPLRSLVAAARLASLHGERLEAGSLVMAGGVTAAVGLTPNINVSCEIQRLGRVSFRTRSQA